MLNPFKAFTQINRAELPLALLMFSYFFLIITSFWILKPLKKTLFITFYDQTGFDLLSWHMGAPQAELLAKVLNMVVAFGAVVVFTTLVRRFRRQQLTFIFTAFFMFCYFLYSLAINNPNGLTVWSFYLFGDLFATLMVATFFAFLNDSVTPDAAKRLYGLVGFGGVSGGVVGTMVLRGLIERLSTGQWLWVCFGLAVLIVLIASSAGRTVSRHLPESITPAASQPKVKRSSGNPALEGAKLVFRSRYLLAIVGIVGFYEVASTLMDFQFTSTIAHYLDGPAIGKQFSTIYTITNMVSMLVQLFLTSLVMTRYGLTVALMILPVAILGGSTVFFALPVLWVGSFLNTIDNGFSYSINQSAKEALYVPTTQDEKYKAKAFIDMFVQRLAKAVAVGISLAITTVFIEFSSLRWLSLFTIVIVMIWIIAVRYAGKKFKERASSVSS